MTKSKLMKTLAEKTAASTGRRVIARSTITEGTKFEGRELSMVWLDEAIELSPRRGPDDGSKETMWEYDDYA